MIARMIFEAETAENLVLMSDVIKTWLKRPGGRVHWTWGVRVGGFAVRVSPVTKVSSGISSMMHFCSCSPRSKYMAAASGRKPRSRRTTRRKSILNSPEFHRSDWRTSSVWWVYSPQAVWAWETCSCCAMWPVFIAACDWLSWEPIEKLQHKFKCLKLIRVPGAKTNYYLAAHTLYDARLWETLI